MRIAIVALYGCATFGIPSEASLRVVSWNVQAGGGRLERIAATLKEINADLVALHEVDVHWHERSGFADQASELARMLSMDVRFAPIYRLPGARADLPPREFGLAILSRFPISAWRNDSLTRLSTQDSNPVPRRMPGLAHATIDVRGRRMSVISVHLDYRADPAVRRQQVGELVRYLGTIDGPVMLAGDLNATPDAEELAPLLALLRDVWPRNNAPGHTYPAVSATKRIDYILVSQHFRVHSTAVAATDASDHRPVVAELLLDRR